MSRPAEASPHASWPVARLFSLKLMLETVVTLTPLAASSTVDVENWWHLVVAQTKKAHGIIARKIYTARQRVALTLVTTSPQGGAASVSGQWC